MARRGRRTTNRKRSPKSPRRGRSKRRSPRRGRSKRRSPRKGRSPRRKVRVVSDILSSRYGLQSSNVSGNKQKTMDEFLEGISSGNETYGIGRMFQEEKKKSRKGRSRKGRSRKGRKKRSKGRSRKGRRTKSGGFFSWF